MRTTVHIEDDLLRDLKEEAQRRKTSMTRLVNRVLRQGLADMRQERKQRPAYREKTFHLGEPKVDLDKALRLAATLEDDEVCEKLARRK